MLLPVLLSCIQIPECAKLSDNINKTAHALIWDTLNLCEWSTVDIYEFRSRENWIIRLAYNLPETSKGGKRGRGVPEAELD